MYLTSRHVLASAVAAALFLGPLSAIAGTVTGPGTTYTVNPGDPLESWSVTDGAALTVAPGAAAADIQVDNAAITLSDGATAGRTTAGNGATVSVTGGSIAANTPFRALSLGGQSSAVFNRGTLSNTGGTALSLLVDSSLVGSSAAFTDSTISGIASAATVSSGSAITLSNSSITATGGTEFDGAITTFGGAVTALNGSVIRGEAHGLSILHASSLAVARPGDGTVIIDGSSVVGTAGSAINVRSDGTGLLASTDIFVRNGASLSGGDGNILTVEQGSATDRITTANLFVEGSVLDGNVLVAADGSVGNVTLSNGGRINGSFTGVNAATIDQGGYWQLTGNSSVNTLTAATGGVVALGNGTAFNTLTVSGNYTGNGGTLLFNTVLAGDDAASDKLVIGGDSS
ncbi:MULTISPECIES: autotransporter outer membrane beta-barrel domain-containing protein, partial [unclassified Stenotrophomonas]|uniref:autotransporter outer membrane beta-barrel domain-containing protein n=1 Tax=unclassified Stenotrophomonas TaxID=196198 RepID=UPI002117F48C